MKEGKIRPEDIDEEMISQHLVTNFMPDPDLLIRTGGEVRISNYLLWQIAYSELYFCDTYWPDFMEEDLHKAIRCYQNRQRRFGKTEAQVEEDENSVIKTTIHNIIMKIYQEHCHAADGAAGASSLLRHQGTGENRQSRHLLCRHSPSYIVGGITVSGVEGYEDYMLSGISGLTEGQTITVPGNEITDAVKRYWRHGLFSNVSVAADSIVGNRIYLHIHLSVRPRVSTINYIGLKKSESEDMEAKLGMVKGGSLTPNVIDRAKILAKKYFDDKGFKNAEINITQRDDVANKNQVILDVEVDKKEKMKVRNIIIDGNKALSDSKIKGGLFKKGAFAKTHEAGKFANFLKSKKFTPERWKKDKQNLIEKYNEYGYRDAVIVEDSVWNVDDKHVNVYVKVDEGKKYYMRNITWVGNTVYPTDYLSKVLGMKKGDVYNQKLMNKRLSEDDDAVGNNYWNNGYLFYNLHPTEVNIVGDSIDLEMRIVENQQAHISHVRINGNDRLYENVVRRELRTKPGDLFSKDALMRSARELASMGHFDPEKVIPDIKPNYEDGTVDINWNLEQKSNDQIEFSLGWGQTGVIGRVGLKLNNFSMRNLFNKNKEHRGIMPIGDGEVLSIGAQTNGTYYQSYNASYSTNWFGGKRPIQFSVGAYYSKQTDINSNYYNSGLHEQLL